jgi:proteasome component ECM29
MADTSKLETIAPVLLSGLLKFIKEHKGVGDAEEAVKGFAYESIGLLSKRGK